KAKKRKENEKGKKKKKRRGRKKQRQRRRGRKKQRQRRRRTRVKPQWKKQGGLVRSRQTQPCVWLDFYILFFLLYGVSKKETPRRRSTTEILDVAPVFAARDEDERAKEDGGRGWRKKQSSKTKRLAGGYSFVWCVGGGRGEETDGGGGGGGSEERQQERRRRTRRRGGWRGPFFCFFFNPSSCYFSSDVQEGEKKKVRLERIRFKLGVGQAFFKVNTFSDDLLAELDQNGCIKRVTLYIPLQVLQYPYR
ncbi:hypothetical protein TESG_08611, partial [Trichophyton tonsurans CBS 112818]